MISMTMIKQISTAFMVYMVVVATASSNLGGVDACRCSQEPSLEAAIESDGTTIIHGMVIRHSIPVDNPSVIQSSIMIRQVYKHGGCYDQRLSTYEIIAIQTPRTSCGIAPTGAFPLYRSFIFTGRITYTSTRARSMLVTDSEVPSNMTTTNVGEKNNIRSGKNRNLGRTPILNVNLCDYTKLSATLTLKERDLLNQCKDVTAIDCYKSTIPYDASPP